MPGSHTDKPSGTPPPESSQHDSFRVRIRATGVSFLAEDESDYNSVLRRVASILLQKGHKLDEIMDAAQTVIARQFERLGEGDEYVSLAPTFVENVIRNCRARLSAEDITIEAAPESTCATSGGDPAHLADRRESLRIVRQSVDSLGEPERTAVRMFYRQHSIEKIARRIERSPRTVQRLLAQARVELLHLDVGPEGGRPSVA